MKLWRDFLAVSAVAIGKHGGACVIVMGGIESIREVVSGSSETSTSAEPSGSRDEVVEGLFGTCDNGFLGFLRDVLVDDSLQVVPAGDPFSDHINDHPHGVILLPGLQNLINHALNQLGTQLILNHRDGCSPEVLITL